MNFYDAVLHYHTETKHHFFRFARSLGYLDWDNQPNPFRRYHGAPLVSLPLLDEDNSPPYPDIYRGDQIAPRPISPQTISQFLEYSLAISAWKEFQGTRWALRVNPSSGNLHPTEGYLVLGQQAGLDSQSAIYHYAPREHALECRTGFSGEVWAGLMADFPGSSFLVGLSSIYWREAWKYGERAFRYCQHDIGHALAALRLAAASLGWQLKLLEAVSDEQISGLLGLDRTSDFAQAETEHPELLTVIYPAAPTTNVPPGLPAAAIEAIASGEWQGRANRLSGEQVPWDIIDAASDATSKPGTSLEAPTEESESDIRLAREASHSFVTSLYPDAPSARKIIHQRRSAVAMDGSTSISAPAFFHILGRLLTAGQKKGSVPWDAIPWSPKIHLGLLVHRVDGLASGLYFLIRNPNHADALKRTGSPDFSWTRPPGCPDRLPLYLLNEGNYQEISAQICCRQRIASDGVFCIAMIAEFAGPLRDIGPWFYRRLFWETGMIGQVLYLEAEAVGIRATGIGCFFDDPTHAIFGFNGEQYQSLYHFTMGGPVEDRRLTTLPAYGHLEQR